MATGRLGLWAPVVAYMAAIFILSNQSSLPGIELRWGDKLLHAIAFCGLGLLALRACHGGLRDLAWRPAAAGVILAVAYGVADEAHQSLVAGRDASVGDVIADACGAVLAVAIYAVVAARRSPRGRGAKA